MIRTPMPTMIRMMAKSRFIRPPPGAGVCTGAVVVVVAVVVTVVSVGAVVAVFDIVSVGNGGAVCGAVVVVAEDGGTALGSGAGAGVGAGTVTGIAGVDAT